MSLLAVYVVAIVALCAVAGGEAQGSIDCYDSRGNLKWPLSTEDLLKCKTWCPPGCPEGRCMRHNLCDCGPGYKDVRTRGQVRRKLAVRCKPVCSKGCINGKCVAPDTCQCPRGYMKDWYNPNKCVKGD